MPRTEAAAEVAAELNAASERVVTLISRVYAAFGHVEQDGSQQRIGPEDRYRINSDRRRYRERLRPTWL
jgi:peptide methionine sulfoxide reductase MsrB